MARFRAKHKRFFKGITHSTLRSNAYEEMIKNHNELFRANQEMLQTQKKFIDDYNRVQELYINSTEND